MKKLFTLVTLIIGAMAFGQIEQFAVYPGCPSFSSNFTKKSAKERKVEQNKIMNCAVNNMQADLVTILKGYDLENNFQTAEFDVLRATTRILVNKSGEIEKAFATSGNKHFQRAVVGAIYELSDKLKKSERYFTAAMKKDGTATNITLTLPLNYNNTTKEVATNLEKQQ